MYKSVRNNLNSFIVSETCSGSMKNCLMEMENCLLKLLLKELYYLIFQFFIYKFIKYR